MITVISLIISFIISVNPTLKTQLDNYLKTQFTQFNSYEYEILNMPKNSSKIEIIKQNELRVQGNLVYIPVNIVEKNGHSARSYLTLKVKLYKKALVATRKIERKQVLTSSDVKFNEVDIAELHGTPITSLKELKSKRSKIFINPGNVILQEMIEKTPVVKSGNRIIAYFAYGNVLVTTDAIARQDGSVGDLISIKTPDSKEFKAKVIDQGHVNIVE